MTPTPTPPEDLAGLAARVEALAQSDNAVDVLIEIALFKPSANCPGIRANSAGTKVIYTYQDGTEATHWAEDWTLDAAHREYAASELRTLLMEKPDV